MPSKGANGSSHRLLVRLDDEECEVRASSKEDLESLTLPTDCRFQASSRKSLAGACSKVLKTVSLTGAAILVGCAVYAALGSAALKTAEEEGSRSSISGKNAVIGSAKVPEELVPAPEHEVYKIGHPSYHCGYDSNSACPASELFFNSEVHEVATENLMQVGRGIFLHADTDLVRETVMAGLRNISEQIAVHAPDSHEALQRIRLDEQAKTLVLTWLRLMSVPKVQTIGYEVSMAIRRSLSHDPDVIRRDVEEMLAIDLGHIRELRDELIPPGMLEYWGSEHQWGLTLDPENSALMQAFRQGEFYGSLDAGFYSKNVSGLVGRLPSEEKAYGAWGGVLEQGRALIDIIKLVAKHNGVEVMVPAQATSLDYNVDVKDLGSELLSCELQKKDGMNNLMKALFCPLKYGSQGLDALRAVHLMEGAA
jgi:hypothetical protein